MASGPGEAGGRVCVETPIKHTLAPSAVRPGDLVAFKDGLFGIKAPQNLAIFIERRKRKKEYLLVLQTTKGRRDVRPEQVSGRKFHANVDPGMDEEAMTARLGDLIKEASDGSLDEAQGTEGELSERKVWEKLVNDVASPESPEALAARLASPDAASKADVRRLEKMLQRCRRPGVGFFERGAKATWMPITVATFKTFHSEMERLNRLRKKLVRLVAMEDDSGETWETYEGVRPGEAGLDDEEHTLLEHVYRDMERFVLEDRWPDDVAPPGIATHTLEGQGYHRFLEWLARDWTRTGRVTLSSAIVQFLVDSGHMTTQDAIRLIARRRVRQAEGFDWSTPANIEEAASMHGEPADLVASDASLLDHRNDLRDLETYTIDPPDAKDFDDAISLIEHGDGSATLWVHIADVSHYVEKDSVIDRHARERATSVYLPTGVLPMLPSRLSDDLCSLREGVDRFAMSVALDVDADGHVVAASPTESVIRVDRNHSYGEADEAIEAGQAPFANLHRWAERMNANRRGLAIETGELRIRFAEEQAAVLRRREGLDDPESDDAIASDVADATDPDDVGLAVQIKRATKATKMIETFMVAANEAVSRFVADRDVPVPYRCHPLPDRSRVERLVGQGRTLGLDLEFDLPEIDATGGAAGGDVSAGAKDDGPSLLDQLAGGKLQLGGFAASDTIGSRDEDSDDERGSSASSADAGSGSEGPAFTGLAQLSETDQDAWLAPFRSALEKVGGVEDERLRDLAYLKVLQTLGRALYTPHNLGHFGLGSTSYAHFTSPIRRYPDLVLHRQLRWMLRRERGLDVGDEPPHAGVHLEALCDHCSARGEAAERLERGLKDCCMTFESRRAAWAEDLRGTVNGITPANLFLSLPGELEARLATRDLPGGPYDVDDHESMLFRGRLPGGQARVADDPEEEALLPLDWRSMADPDTGEVREVRVRLGDRVPVRITERDLVEGRVAVRLAGRL